jgi:hypothetical protein
MTRANYPPIKPKGQIAALSVAFGSSPSATAVAKTARRIGHCVANVLAHNGCGTGAWTPWRLWARDMAIFNKFGIIPVVRGLDGKLLVQKEFAFPSEEEALRAGQIFAGVLGGAVAFRRTDDPDTGIIGQGVIIGKYGVMAEAPSAAE